MGINLGSYRLHTAALCGFGRTIAIAAFGTAAVGVALVVPSGAHPAAPTSATAASSTNASPLGASKDDKFISLDPATAAGDAPGTAYALDGLLHFPDGSQVPIASERGIVDVASIGDNAAVLHAYEDGSVDLVIYAPDGEVVMRYASVDGPLVSNDGYSLVGFLTAEGETIVLADGGGSSILLPATPATLPQLRALEGGTVDDATVIVRDADDLFAGSYEVTSDSVVLLGGEGAAEVSDLDAISGDAHQYLATIAIDEEEATTTSGLLSFDFADIWHQDDFGVRTFSPLGNVIEAGPAWADGLGDGELALLDAPTGDLLHWLVPVEHLWITQTVWEDVDSLLVTIADDAGTTVSVLRVDTDGHVETAVADAETYVG